jgi:hypothetical protein
MSKILKKYGKWGLYAFLAYQVVGLTFLALNFETIWTQSQSIATSIIGEK